MTQLNHEKHVELKAAEKRRALRILTINVIGSVCTFLLGAFFVGIFSEIVLEYVNGTDQFNFHDAGWLIAVGISFWGMSIVGIACAWGALNTLRGRPND